MIAAAFDLSKAAVGWAVDGDGRPRLGAWKGAAGVPVIGRAGLIFGSWLSDFIAVNRPALIAVEAPAIGGVPMSEHEAMLLIGMAFMTASVAEANGIRFERAHVATVRKHFCGSGRAKKPDVAARCKALGWEAKNWDEADAAALWCWAKSSFDRSFRIETGTPLFAGGSAS